ncbi:MAG TPA: hypothetical protein VGN16_18660 [Acidobacteriaceae bacterium]|jgi:hypothetical protein
MVMILLALGLLNPSAPPPIRPKPAALAVSVQGDGSSSHLLAVGGGLIEVDVHLDDSDLTMDDVLSWVQRSAEAVANYYGRFPVHHARVIVTQSSDAGHSIHGTTWGNIDGSQGLTRIRLGRSVTKSDLAVGWTMTHELVHMALTSLPDENHWLEEGLATYIEPIARAEDGQLAVAEVWREMLDDMQKGEPASGDRGLDRTHTWGRTYWGGALFCLVADIEIRRATANHKSLQDALRAIVAAGATIDTERPLLAVLRIGDHATGTTVLEDLYSRWKDKPVTVDLDQLWSDLGVQQGPHGITFDDHSPLANIRRSMIQLPRSSKAIRVP